MISSNLPTEFVDYRNNVIELVVLDTLLGRK